MVVDLDGDGLEETGWNLIYLHIATTDRVPVGTWLEQGSGSDTPAVRADRPRGRICIWPANTTANGCRRKAPWPDLQGWEARAGRFDYKGWLVRGDQVITANLFGAQEAHISRENEFWRLWYKDIYPDKGNL